jgi:deazaflavin-dependent oxidoreductase (nitroreductase family)
MTAIPVRKPPRNGLLRFVLALPLWCYRAHLGWLVGERILMLTHYGHHGSHTRQIILEVVRSDRQAGVYIASSAWSEQPEWFRHMKKNLLVKIDTGEGQFLAMAECVSTTEAECELQDYARRHPLAFRAMLRLTTGRPFTDTLGACRLLAHTLPIVVVRTGKKMC